MSKKKTNELLEYLFETMNPHLEDGYEYINDFHVDEEGNTGLGLFYKYSKGIKDDEHIEDIDVFDDENSELAEALEQLSGTFEKARKTKVIAKKDKPIEIHVCNAQDLISDIKSFYSSYLKGKYEIKTILDFKSSEDSWQIVDTKIESFITVKGKEEELERHPIEDYEYLYLILNKDVSKLKIEISEKEIKTTANKAFPNQNIDALIPENYQVSNDDLEGICKYLESGNDDKIKAALKATAENKDTKDRIERRYLNFIKARLCNQNATLEDISPDILSQNAREVCDGYHAKVDENYIDFGYDGKEESKLTIDFIGAMVKNYVDVEEYIKEHDEIYSKEKVSKKKFDDLQIKWVHILYSGINTEVELHSDGWYSKAYSKLRDAIISKIQFNKSEFHSSDKLPFLKEYMFYLNYTSRFGPIYFDVYSSINIHDLTEVYWMFKRTPEIHWFQTTPSYPKVRYASKEVVKFKIDGSKWKRMSVNEI